MDPVEYDVFICCREPSGSDLATLLSAGLAQRGFRVFFENRVPMAAPDPRRLQAIDETPDFVLVLTPDVLDPSAGELDATRIEVARALNAACNVVVVTVPGTAHPKADSLPPDLALLAESQGMAYDPDRSQESVARLGHRLSSETSLEDRREMHGARRLFIIAGLFILAIAAVEVARVLPGFLVRPPDTRPLPPMVLYWSGFGQRLADSHWIEFALGDGAQVFAGDQVKLTFSTSADGNAYVMARDLAGEISVLFPVSALKAASRVRARALYEAPVETRWFTVDEKAGLDTLFVVASYDPIENLEELVEETGGKVNAEARRALLDSTIVGLLDGRHGVLGRRVHTRSGRPISQSLTADPGPTTSSATLAGGEVVTRRLAAQPGLLSAVAEIRLQFQRSR